MFQNENDLIIEKLDFMSERMMNIRFLVNINQLKDDFYYWLIKLFFSKLPKLLQLKIPLSLFHQNLDDRKIL